MTYKVALIGLGRIAWRGFDGAAVETHMDGIDSHGGLELVAACDLSEAVRADFSDFHPGVPVHSDAQNACREADIAVICTPPDTHAAIVGEITALPNVKAVICEKPLAQSVQDCEKIVSFCADRVLIVGHQRRYESAHRAAQRFIDSGAIGHVKAAVAHFPGDYLNNGSHAADLCRFMVGDHNPWGIRQTDAGFGITVTGDRGSVSIESYGYLRPGYMRAMYQDAINCIEHRSQRPVCSGEDGTEAVRHALFAQERDANG